MKKAKKKLSRRTRIRTAPQFPLPLPNKQPFPAQPAQPSQPVSPPAGPSSEVALHELGESIAASILSVQNELTRYPNSMGAYVLDDVELVLPVQMRVDDLGQVRTTVVQDPNAANTTIGQLRLRVKPVLGAQVMPTVNSNQSLESLGTLSQDDIDKLKAQRIFNVDDLMRIGQLGDGLNGLTRIAPKVDWSKLVDKAAVLNSHVVPTSVTKAILDLGIGSPEEFMQADPDKLAGKLTDKLNSQVTPDQVAQWQKHEYEAKRFTRNQIVQPFRPKEKNNG